ncbi:MAG: hypothetical protein ACSHWU_09320, partial [Marinicella sp.]
TIPREGDSVAVDLGFHCPYYPAFTPDGDTHFVENLADNTIRLTLVFELGDACPGVSVPSGRGLYTLGNLSEGEYSLEIDYITNDQFFPPLNPLDYLSNLDGFQVFGTPVSVPILSNVSLLILVFSFLIFAFVVMRPCIKFK